MTTGTSVGDDLSVIKIHSTDEEIAKARKDRERELVSITETLYRLLSFTEIWLSLTASLSSLEKDEISGTLSETIVLTDSPRNWWTFVLNLNSDGGYMNYPCLDSFMTRGWSYSFWVVSFSSAKEVKFSLSKYDLERLPLIGWRTFEELYLGNSGPPLHIPMITAASNLFKKVNDFFEKKVAAIDGTLTNVFIRNAYQIAVLVGSNKQALEDYSRYRQAFLAYDLLVAGASLDLRNTKSFTKSKRLAEIREKLENRSREIVASVNR